MSVNISVVGAGINGAGQLTLNAIQAIKQSDKVFTLGFISDTGSCMEEIEKDYEDISFLYQEGAMDQDNYNSIFNFLLSSCESNSSICLVVGGHPRFGVTLVQMLEEHCNKNSQYILSVLPGISSFATMINDLAIDPIEEGTCLVDANRLLLYNYNIDPCLKYFFYHVFSIGNPYTDYIDPVRRNRTSLLRNKWSCYYSDHQPVYLISSSVNKSQKSDIKSDFFRNFEKLLANVSFKHTLFIPAVLPKKEQINSEFYAHILGNI